MPSSKSAFPKPIAPFVLPHTWLWALYLSIMVSACDLKLPERPPDLFYKHVTLSAVDGPSDILVRDLNLDGNLDLAIANMRANLITLYYGNGDGTFPNRFDLKVFPEPSSIVAGDLNHDGFPDLILNSRGTDSLTLLISNGKGGFNPAQSLKTGRVPLAVLLADFNKDGHLDLAVTLTFNKFEIYIGRGTGKFKRGPAYTTGSRSESGIAIDLNEDGHLDIALAVTSSNASSIRIYSGFGDGTFQQTARIAQGEMPLRLATQDMNVDQHMDILAATGKRDNLILLYGKGNGSFQTPINFSGGGGPLDLTVDHFNGDSFLDVAVANSRSSSFSIIFRSPRGGFQYPSLDYVVEGGTPIAIASGDFNRDGRMDIAVSSDTNNTIEVYLQKMGLQSLSVDLNKRIASDFYSK